MPGACRYRKEGREILNSSASREQPRPPDAVASPLDLKSLLAREADHLVSLSEEHINPSLCRVLGLLGFNKRYTRGKGAYLFDEAGNRYLDCLSGFGTFACGRNHPVIRDAIQQAMDLDLPNLVAMGVAPLSGLLARELLQISPGDLEMVFFANSGTEGVEAAIKYARYGTGRARMIHCTRSFHGLSLGSLSVNGNEEFKEGFGPMLGPTTAVPFNDLEALERELSQGDVAGFIVEPIQGKGVFVPSDDYLPEAVKLCHKHGALFIADEVQTGLGRTGKMFACEHWGVEPDILIIGQSAFGGLYSRGRRDDQAVAARESLFQARALLRSLVDLHRERPGDGGRPGNAQGAPRGTTRRERGRDGQPPEHGTGERSAASTKCSAKSAARD